MFLTVLSDQFGNLFAEPGVETLGRVGRDMVSIREEDMIPLPAGSTITMLPGRAALGTRHGKKGGKRVEISRVEGERVFPAAGIIPPGYTRTMMPACAIADRDAPVLPHFAYTALGMKGEQLYCAAIETHSDIRWDPYMYNSLELPRLIKRKKKALPKNRLLEHLENCSLSYRCFTAQNIFYSRWEGGIPVSAACNAQCAGCISKSHTGGVESPQERISFVPSVEEIVEIAVPHLKSPGGIVSFGQGCEGEPLTRFDLIRQAVALARQKTGLGTININTNGSMPRALQELFGAGLNSARISLNSPDRGRYHRYVKPSGFTFEEVLQSIDVATAAGGFVSLNYIYMPGVNDREEEVESFLRLLREHPVNMIQVRNLNMDPDAYFREMEVPRGKAMGTRGFLDLIRKEFPGIIIGNFSIPHPGARGEPEERARPEDPS
jgi:pyruvate-formate lyase-activating enzyme